MKRIAIASFLGLGCALALFAAVAAEPSPKAVKSPWLAKQGITYQNLTIYPVVWNTNGSPEPEHEDYITLDEGLAKGTVTVTETGAGSPLIRNRGGGSGFHAPQAQQSAQGNSQQRQIAGSQQGGPQVNTLYIVNKSGKKLLLLAGEMVVGGKQDRIIQKDGIIPPTGKPFDLAVFCVEQGRWSGSGVAFQPVDNTIVTAGFKGGGGFGGAVADPTVRGEAQANRNQGGVWAKVSEKNSQARANPSSGTYLGTVNSAKAQKDAKPYHDALLDKMPKNAVGAVIAIHGKVVWADVFGSSDLFRAYWPKLLQSYVVDAMTSPPPQEPANERVPRILRSPPTVQDAQKYLDERGGKTTFEGEEGLYRLSRSETAGHLIFELYDMGVQPPLALHYNKMAKAR